MVMHPSNWHAVLLTGIALSLNLVMWAETAWANGGTLR